MLDKLKSVSFLQCGHASAGAIESCTLDSEIYFSNSEHCRSVVSESVTWNGMKIKYLVMNKNWSVAMKFQ